MQWKGISKLFYENVIVHLIGIIVFVFGVISLVSSFVTSDEKKKLCNIYNVDSLEQTKQLSEGFKSNKFMGLVLPIDGQKVRSILRRSRIHPPFGRLVHWEVDPAYLPFPMS